MARIVWCRIARDDLKAIGSYIRADSPAYAKSFAFRLRQRIAQLEAFPESGRHIAAPRLSPSTCPISSPHRNRWPECTAGEPSARPQTPAGRIRSTTDRCREGLTLKEDGNGLK